MNDKLFRKFRDLIYQVSGIYLADNKKTLLTSRMRKRMRALGMDQDDFEAYYKLVYEDAQKKGQELISMIDAISTNHTYFFREEDHFDVLKKKFEEWLETEGKGWQARFRVWSAASSYGQEPYSIAMVLRDLMEKYDALSKDVKILATDISIEALSKAHLGNYSEAEVKSIPRLYFRKYVEKKGNLYHIKSEIRKLIFFRRLNLSKPPFPISCTFDIVFCRNVMYYFDLAVKKRLVKEMYKLLKDGGLLIVSHTENLRGIDTKFKYVTASVYQK